MYRVVSAMLFSTFESTLISIQLRVSISDHVASLKKDQCEKYSSVKAKEEEMGVNRKQTRVIFVGCV